MRKTLIWIIVVFLLNTLNYLGWVGWRFDELFFIPDIITTIGLGIAITILNYIFNKNKNRYIDCLCLSLMLGLLIMPFILHFYVAIKLFETTIGTNATFHGIFMNGIISSIKVTLYAVIIFYPIIALMYLSKSVMSIIKKFIS